MENLQLQIKANEIRKGIINGVYHAKFDCWQQIFGYNDLYDILFDLGTSMESKRFHFSYGGTSYVFWMWKGDYINLTAKQKNMPYLFL